MSQFINSLRNVLLNSAQASAKIVGRKPRRVHQIQFQHARRFNAYKVAGYSFGALTALVMGPIILWPIADVWLLPNVIRKTLETEPHSSFKEKHMDTIWGRDFEISQIEYMMESKPNNIWILNGTTNSGKTAFIKKLLSSNKGIIYVDLRHFFDGNAFVFEMIDSLYASTHNGSLLDKIVGCYVKLFTFVTATVSNSDQHITAMLYFHAILSHLKAGINKYNDSNNDYPLLIFDHFEALPSALKNCKDTKNREMLSFIIYSISQFSSSVCHDLSQSHVLFVGNDFFTFSNKEKQVQTEGLIADDIGNDTTGCINYLSSSILRHCEYWNMDGINKDIAIDHVTKQFNDYLGINNYDKNMVKELINSIGTKPHDISVAIKAVTSVALKSGYSFENESLQNNKQVMITELNQNIKNYIEHYNKSQRFKLRSQLNDNKGDKVKFNKFVKDLDGNEDNLMEWNDAMECFDNDQELMIKLIDNNILTRKHGKKLSSNYDELIKMKLLGKDDSIYVGTIGECCDSLILKS